MSKITTATIDGIVCTAGGAATITTASAGHVITLGGVFDAKLYVTVHLSSTARRTPELARIEPTPVVAAGRSSRQYCLPAMLPPDTYTMTARQPGEKFEDAAKFTLVVAPVALGSISGVLFNDDDGDGSRDPNESPTGVRPVYAAVAGVRVGETQSDERGVYKFSGIAAGDYIVSREFPAGYEMSNVAAKSGNGLMVTVASGQQVTGVDIGTRKIAPAKPVDADPTPVTPGEGTDPTPVTPAKPVRWGFAANGDDSLDAYKLALAAIVAAGGTWIKLWTSGEGKIDRNTVQMIRLARAAGVDVILCVQSKDSETEPKLLGTPDFDAWVQANKETLLPCEWVEVGNELNLIKYRPDDLGSNWYQAYVDHWLKPLSIALAKIGVRTLVASVTESEHPERYAQHAAGLKAAGADKWAKGAAIHCYFYADGKPGVSTISMLPAVLKTYSRILGLDLYVTEANPHKTVGTGDDYLNVQVLLYAAGLIRSGVVKVVIWYRGVPNGTPSNARSQRPLCDAAGKPTPVLAAVVGAMTRAAA